MLLEITSIKRTTDNYVVVEFQGGRIMPLRRRFVEFFPGMVQMPGWYYEYLKKGLINEKANHH